MNIRSGFNLDFSATRAGSRALADAMIRQGEIEAEKIRTRDRGLESGLGTIGGAIVGGLIAGPEGALYGASVGRNAATGNVSGLALDAATSGMAKKKKVATDPMQAASASNSLPADTSMYGTVDAPDPNYLKKFFS